MAAAVFALAAPITVLATGTLDQENTATGTAFGQIGTWDGDGSSPTLHAQTFVAGISGNLDQIDIPLRVVGNPGVPLTVEIRTTSGGQPTATTIGGASVAQASVQSCACLMSDFSTFRWDSITLTSPAPVVAGAMYALVLSAPGAAGNIFGIGDVGGAPTRSAYEWAGDGADTYFAGTHFSQPLGWYDTEHDLAFKTYVTATPTYSAVVGQPINADGSSAFKANKGVVPVKFTLSAAGSPTCSLPAATISLTRTSGADPGSVNESAYLLAADTGSNFRISDCQYIYNLNLKLLPAGDYTVEINIGGAVVGSADFELR